MTQTTNEQKRFTVKKGLRWVGKELAIWGLTLGAMVFAGRFGLKIYDYNNKINDTAYAVASGLVGNKQISNVQADHFLGSAKNAEIHFFEFLKEKYDKEGILATFSGLKDLYQNVTNPGYLDLKSKEIALFGNGIVDDNEKKEIILNAAMDALDKEWDEDNVNNYQTALKEYSSTKFDTSVYESKFNKLNKRHDENVYFDELSENISNFVDELKQKGYDNNTIATEIGLYFSENMDKAMKEAPITEIDLKVRTAELSKKISTIMNYKVSLDDYL